jgi:hypothetical protein
VRSRRKSLGNLPSGEIKRKERLITKIMTHNYEGKLWLEKIYYRKLLVEIITGNYQLVYYVAEKCVNYRDTDVSKNMQMKTRRG